MNKGKQMIVRLLALCSLLLLGGCATPTFKGQPISAVPAGSEVVIVTSNATRNGFRNTMENWLKDHQYSYVVVPQASVHDSDKLTLEYVGRWSWDLATFLSEARINAYQHGNRVGQVEFEAANSLSLKKYGEGTSRIRYMMDVLFGEMPAEEVTQRLNESD